MNISCCAWSLPGNEYDTLRTISRLSRSFIDIQSKTFLNHNSSEIQGENRHQFSCIGLSFNMPDHASMDSPNRKERASALDHIKSGIDHAYKYGINSAYVIPGLSHERISYFNEVLLAAADLAAAAKIKLCVEHFPQRALPTAMKTIEHLKELDHHNLFLLIDSGHLQISKEDPKHIVEKVGERLGYVHLNDNDGERDLHWALCTGVMTLNSLKILIQTLRSNSYTGALSIELNPALSAPVRALHESLSLLKNILYISQK